VTLAELLSFKKAKHLDATLENGTAVAGVD